jgi:ElaB/YqjD/DUF883 family membrane-anchored ribosome-binding protein
MKAFGNGGEALREKGEALRERMEEGARAVGEEIEHTFYRVRDRAADVSGRAIGFAKDHPLATAATLAAGIGVGFLIVRMLRR